MTNGSKIFIFILCLVTSLFAITAQASDQRKLTYAGRILKPDQSPVNGVTQFKIQITDTAGTCILWEENSSINVSNGVFNLLIGNGTNVFDGGGSGSLNKIFSQGASINCKAGGSTSPTQYDDRNLAVSFNDGSGWQSLSSQIPIKAVPFALSTSGIGGAQVDLTGLADTYVLKYSSATNTWIPAANGAGAGVSSVTAGTGISLTGTASNPIVNLTTPVSTANGGTGVNSAAAANGQLLIGNGAGFSLANLTQGAGITITNSAGGITIAATGSGTVTSVTAAATAGNPITIGGTASTPTVDITAAASGVNGYLTGADWNTFNGKLSAVSASATLANTKIWIGDGAGKAQEKNLSQDVTIDNLGVATINKIQNRLIDSTSAVGGVLSWDVGTSTWKAKAFPSCTTAQTPYFNGVADAIQCQSIAAAWASVSGKPTTLAGYSITDGIQNAGVGAGNIITTVQSGNTAGRPAFGTDGRIYIDTQAAAIYRDSGAAWVQVSGAGGGGTVTSVSSLNADIGVSMASPTPVLTLNSGTAGGAGDANKIAKLDAGGLLTPAMIPNISATKITSGVLPLNVGGTNANLTANNGGIVWSNGSQMQILNGTPTAGLPLISGATATPSWSTINLSSGNIQMPAGGNISNAAGAMTVSATTNLTVAAGGTGLTTLGSATAGSATQINAGATGGLTLSPNGSNLTVTGFTSGFVKSSAGGVLTGGNSINLSTDVTAALLPAANMTVMVGATGVLSGVKGAVPQPAAGDDTKYLRGDGTWQTVSAGGVTTVAAIDTNANANGLYISGANISTQSASATNPGMVNTAAQTFAGTKTFNGGVILGTGTNLTGPAGGYNITQAAAGTGPITVSTTNNQHIALMPNGTGNVGIGTTSPTTGTRLDITGTGAAASSIIIPRDTVANRPTVGVNGMIRYASDTNKFEAYENGAWTNMISAAGGGALSGITAATATNSISNANYAQTWNWNTLNTQSGLNLTANALTTGSILNISSSSAVNTSSNGLLYVGNSTATTTGTIARFQASSSAGSGMTINANGKVGVGTTSPTAQLEVQGQIVAKEYIVATGAAVDFTNGNVQILQAPGAAALTLSNMVNGAHYTIVIEDTTSRTYSFTGCATTRASPAIAATSGRSVFSILKLSTACYVTWSDGF